MFDNAEFMDDYSRGMEMLRLANRAFGGFVSSLGYPIANESIPTAQVQVNFGEERIEFHINPHFIHELRDSEIAAVLAHEGFHIALNHLTEIGDRVEYPEHSVLVDAQECIINDGLPGNIGFHTMAGTFKGLERHDQDFSLFSSREGYDFIMSQRQQDQQEDKDEQEQKSSGGSGEGDGSGNSEKSDKDPEGTGPGEEEKDGDDKKDDEQDSTGSGDEEDSEQDGSAAGDDDSDGDQNGDQDGDASQGGEAGSAGSAAGDGSGSCHGIVIVGDEDGNVDLDKLKEIIKNTVTKAMGSIDTTQLPTDVQDALEELADEIGTPQPGYSLGQPKDGFQTIDRFSSMNVNWVQLLAEINPKLRDRGRPKHKDAWHAPRRRMLHSYPNVILPTSKRMDSPRGKGDSIPTFIIALDMSGSIPERLLTNLAAFAASVPPELIRAFPITWSDSFKIFDPERPREIVRRGGTTIQTVMNYANQVEKESKVRPYVLVITDGDYNIPYGWDKAEIMDKWYWMGIQAHDRSRIQRSTGAWTKPERIFNLGDFVS